MYGLAPGYISEWPIPLLVQTASDEPVWNVTSHFPFLTTSVYADVRVGSLMLFEHLFPRKIGVVWLTIR